MNKYGLKFEYKNEDCADILATHNILLKNDDRSFVHNKSKDQNILIEGENFHAIKILEYTHSNKIDVIYIDPPYNTGNKDFVYNDVFIDNEDNFKHSKWLSFISRRLEIAKKLLKDNGVIFISIDDNEMAQLKLLCDNIFGENNFIANIIWKKKSGGANDAGHIAVEHEYILVYAKNAEYLKLNQISQDVSNDPNYKHEDSWMSTRGKFKLRILDDQSLRYSDSLKFSIQDPDGNLIMPEHCWRWSKDKVEWGIKEDRLYFKKNMINNKYKIYIKQYQFEDNEGNKIERSTPFRAIIDDIFNTHSAKELKEIFGESKVFNYAKPTTLIKRLIFIASQKDSIILDFFAGSGTTGQAVAELNNEDGGNRKFILITNNDKSEKIPKGICEEITYPRLYKTICDENLTVYKIISFVKECENISQMEKISKNNSIIPIICLMNDTIIKHEEDQLFVVFTNNTQNKFISFIYSHNENKVIKRSEILNIKNKLKNKYSNIEIYDNILKECVEPYFKFIK